MTKYLATYAATLFAFLAIDFVWLGFIATRFYKEQLGPMMLDKPLLGVAFAFYALYALGIVIFAVTPGLREGSWRMAAVLGGLLGLIAYGTYDLTNLATLKGWPVTMTFVDIAWGVILTAATASAGYWAANLID